MPILTMILLALNLVLAALILILLHIRRGKADSALEQRIAGIAASLDSFERYLRDDLQRLRNDLLDIGSGMRTELTASIGRLTESTTNENRNNREETSAALTKLAQQINADASRNREELTKAQIDLSESLSRRLQELTSTQQTRFDTLKTALEQQMEQIRTLNEAKLEQMRKTVDEKLHETLEKRLGESFQLVSERLELVHRGLGEMQNLATGVGDLKKVLFNVKNRGILGEYQLENILEDLFTPEQYEKNFKPRKRSDQVVEFALRLPGRDELDHSVYLPIDSKFPIEDYLRLGEDYESGDKDKLEADRKRLIASIRTSARDIRDKYINPPVTTDFAILFLPFEGLYAEILRSPGLFETVMRECGVIIGGPTTIAALLNSLQVGFRTLAIHKKTSEVWKLLGAIKRDFSNFGEILEKTKRKIDDAGRELDNASHRSRQIEKKLTRVQELPSPEAAQIVDIDAEENLPEPR